jgi:integrase
MTRPNGSLFRRNGKWGYVYSYDDNGTRRQRKRQGFTTKDKAQRELVENLANLNRVDIIESTDTLGEYLTVWLDLLGKSGNVKYSTVRARRDHIKNYLVPQLGHIRLNELKHDHVANMYAELVANGRKNKNTKHGDGLSPKSVRDIGSTLVRALNDAIKSDKLIRNVASKVQLPRYERPDITPYDELQVRELLEHANRTGDYFAPVWRLLIASGMRRGEICGLKWCDVNMYDGTIAINETRLTVDGKVVTETPKTRKSRRVTSLDPGTITELAKFRNAQDDAKARLGSWHSPYVVTDLDGQPINPDRLSRLFKRACVKAGLPMPRLHDTRHTSVTLGMSAGVPIHVLSGRVGHSNVTTTLNVYSAFLPRADKLAGDVIGATMNPVVDLDSPETRTQLSGHETVTNLNKPTEISEIRRSQN